MNSYNVQRFIEHNLKKNKKLKKTSHFTINQCASKFTHNSKHKKEKIISFLRNKLMLKNEWQIMERKLCNEGCGVFLISFNLNHTFH